MDACGKGAIVYIVYIVHISRGVNTHDVEVGIGGDGVGFTVGVIVGQCKSCGLSVAEVYHWDQCETCVGVAVVFTGDGRFEMTDDAGLGLEAYEFSKFNHFFDDCAEGFCIGDIACNSIAIDALLKGFGEF